MSPRYVNASSTHGRCTAHQNDFLERGGATRPEPLRARSWPCGSRASGRLGTPWSGHSLPGQGGAPWTPPAHKKPQRGVMVEPVGPVPAARPNMPWSRSAKRGLSWANVGIDSRCWSTLANLGRPGGGLSGHQHLLSEEPFRSPGLRNAEPPSSSQFKDQPFPGLMSETAARGLVLAAARARSWSLSVLATGPRMAREH
jgi:hypothetical protein